MCLLTVAWPRLQERWSWNDFPLYHTMFETYEAMQYLDPDLTYHLALGQLWALVGLRLADDALLPCDVRREAEPLRRGLQELRDHFGALMETRNISLGMVWH